MIAGTLGLGRNWAQARFTETFTFYTESESTDPVTLNPTTVETVVASGVAGRLKFTNTDGRDVESGGQFPIVSRREIHVGVGTVSAAPGVLVRCTTSTVDPSLVGRVFRVSDRPQAGQTTAHRFPVEEVS
ncbi:hypothetical protein J2Y46_002604 [Microbacterium sp. BE35]|uniref:DUF6093 family protein n=1 Tax=Microbacterium sp. BE35 TaxID=2817773 RepID=UPI00285F01C3|nr:DUF6093 family protein [Microbacterium sp. BE35]MDR7189778.1 hypothetical protein [Microbacterium sp. BE35]